jgi:hypothetical protein
MMATFKVKIEGQEIPLPEEIGATDEGVKKALAPFYPDVANALITRVEKDGEVTITVVKRAGTKGADDDGADHDLREGADHDLPLRGLVGCRGGRNPAVALYVELQQRGDDLVGDAEAMLALDKRVEIALKKGTEQAEMVSRALRRLGEARAQAAPGVIKGF